jgi:hypothetical protein
MDISAIGKLLGGGTAAAAVPVVIMYGYFVEQRDFDRYVAQNRVSVIYELLDRAASATDPEYKGIVCRSLEEEFNSLCFDSPDHPLCDAEAGERHMLLEKVGCR